MHIKPDVHFSPPVDRAVNSEDVAYAIERGANPNVANPYFQAYFGDIVGASNATGGSIAGIRTPNPTTIVFHLSAPTADLLIGALTLPLSAPVPKSFAARFDAMKPSQYGTSYEVSTGPYMLESDASGRFLGLGYRPGTSATLVRNPNWARATDPAPAYLDRIDIKIGGASEVIGRQVLQGSDAVQSDIPTNTNVALAYQHYYRQLVAAPGAGDNYVSLNNAHGVLANVNVRRAVYAALDRTAMVKLAGGAVVGQVGTHFITPGTAGFAQAGSYAGPQVPWNEHPEGDIALAKTYMRRAGYPSGRYTGRQVIKIVGSSNGNGPAETSIVRNAFTTLGFKVDAVNLDTSVMYTKYCTVPAAEVDVCPSVGFSRDFADPQTLLYTTFYGPSITPTNNSNWSMVSWQDWPKANRRHLRGWAADAARPGDQDGRDDSRGQRPGGRVGQGRPNARRGRGRRADGLVDQPKHRVQRRQRRQRPVERRGLGLRVHVPAIATAHTSQRPVKAPFTSAPVADIAAPIRLHDLFRTRE